MMQNEILKQYFGYDSFRKGQEDIISSILAKRDVLAIMPTGAGKSICYQIPALMLPGITIVVSPLISLMQDQVRALNDAGIHAAYINSTLSEGQIKKALSLAVKGQYKIIYVAPERLGSWDFLEFAINTNISMVTVDEAHCISQWGQDFRPSYLKIVDFIEKLPYKPVVSAFTATATSEVKDDIQCVLKLQHPDVFVRGFDRENLYYQVENTRHKTEFVIDYLEKHKSESGIIYCATRKNVDELYGLLDQKGYAVARYHAGMSTEDRNTNQEDFIYDRVSVIIATNAFGMGIDKSNVRYVIHYNMPRSMESYYQEAGRAGRDGENARCILLFSMQDVMINKRLLESKTLVEMEASEMELIKQRDHKRLQIMENYCRTTECLRNYILNYFGETTAKPCDNCGNCHREYLEMDHTEHAKWIINCVVETKGRYGIKIVTGTLHGANRARLKELHTMEYKSYGKLQDMSETEIDSLIHQMIEDGYLYQTQEKYSVLKIGDISALRDGSKKVVLRTYQEKEPIDRKVRTQRKTDKLTKAGFELFEHLRQLRLTIAREEAMPPYIIFSDKTLIDMCVKTPSNRDEMMNVNGVGVNKFDKYGQRFLDEIEKYVNSNNDVVLSLQLDTEQNEEKRNTVPRRKKEEFNLTQEEAERFEYQNICFLTDIKEKLNRLIIERNVKKISGAKVFAMLVEEGLVVEEVSNGISRKRPTELGIKYGIQECERISQNGNKYFVLLYPESVQKIIVEKYVKR